MRGQTTIFTIYRYPSDYPEHYVVRQFKVSEDGESYPDSRVIIAGSLEEARKTIPDGLVWMEKDASDDQAIIESWV